MVARRLMFDICSNLCYNKRKGEKYESIQKTLQ